MLLLAPVGWESGVNPKGGSHLKVSVLRATSLQVTSGSDPCMPGDGMSPAQ